jgi:prepilin-type N-terminal cleavage/methylation domain-containing protein/prepilin-type processing-associated H-X9-DG protein
MKNRHAFTLIELLVVIAVIAILMAILTPALAKAREQAKKVVCTAHIKSLGVSLRMYVDDFAGKTHDSPNRGLWDSAWEGASTVVKYGPNDRNAYWGIAYYPYASNKRIFRCPSSRRVDDWPEEGWGSRYQQYFRHCTYGLNGYVKNKKIDHVFKKHDEVIAFQDHIEQFLEVTNDSFTVSEDAGVNLTQWRPGSDLVNTHWRDHDTVQECYRHTNVSMTCWLDGHVSGIRRSDGQDVPRHWYTGKPTDTEW